MEPGFGSYGFGFLAGVLSLLSPCVLPLVPIVVGTAVTAHPLGAVALAAGLAVSFTSVGLFAATIGFSIGFDTEWFRHVAAILLAGFGAVLLSATLQQRFAGATSSLSTIGDRFLRRMKIDGWTGQLVVGLVLGLIWAPCVGPTLGAAATLASQGSNLGQVAVVMAVFGIGAGLPLAVIGQGSRNVVSQYRGKLLKAGALGKVLLGAMMVIFGVSIIAGWDKSLEAFLVSISPAWLTELTTRF